jgi:hypothetical protein
MSNSLVTYNLRTDEELAQILAGCHESLAELAPYNGTAPGAAAIAETRHQMELVQAEIDRRKCDHHESLHGRCTACGMTWEEQSEKRANR